MTNLSFTQLTYIVALAEAKNFRSAAQKCRISQPTLSIQIQKLEGELGTMLFDRSRQPIVPTTIGEKVIEQARKILQDVRQIEEILVHEKEELSGTLRLAVIPTLASYLLPLFLPKFSKKYPKVRLELLELETKQIISRLKLEEIDAGVLVTPLGDSAIQEKPIFFEPFWAYISDSHPLSRSASIKSKDLPLSELWLLKEGHCFREQVIHICETKRGKAGGRSLPQFESGSLDSLKALVDQGIGLTLLPDLAVRRLSRPEEKKRVKAITYPEPVREVSLVQTRLFAKKRIIDALIEVIRESVPKALLEKRSAEVIEIL